jgi:hypothetical protein
VAAAVVLAVDGDGLEQTCDLVDFAPKGVGGEGP